MYVRLCTFVILVNLIMYGLCINKWMRFLAVYTSDQYLSRLIYYVYMFADTT